MQQFHIIDTLGPFAIRNHRATINWSKIDFSSLESGSRLSPATRRSIVKRFERYAQKVAGLGYDSISIDDLAHLAIPSFYSPNLTRLLEDYKVLYGELFRIASANNLQVFVNTDYLFFNDDIQHYLTKTRTSPLTFYQDILRQVFTDFPDIAGVILRIGENDGKDVSGTFKSRLLLKTPAQANRLLKAILPLFEQQGKKLIFRTWTVGVYKIGDLIWNKKTYNTVFGSINSDALIISMKFGDTDFMRYLDLNPLFKDTRHNKIIELQTRREWEGMGEFPSFVGWDYQRYFSQLPKASRVVGIHVWCQTGGWAKSTWSAVTYFDEKSFWNELNTEVTIAVTKQRLSVEEAIKRFCITRNITQTDKFIEILHLADIAILKGLYLPEAAKKPLYFRRTRMPPLTWLTWDKVHLPSVVVQLHRLLVLSPIVAVQNADEATHAAEQMVQIATQIKLRKSVINSLIFEEETLRLFAQLRRYMFGMLSSKEISRLNHKAEVYQRQFSQHYTVPTLALVSSKRRPPRFLVRSFIREVIAYRKRDRLLLATSPIQARLVRLYLRRSKSHLADQSMGFEVFFK